MRKLCAYWVDGKANFGDSATPELLAHLFGQSVVWVDKWHTELLSVGSLLGWALLKNRRPGLAGNIDAVRMCLRRLWSKRVTVFGTGFLFDPLSGSTPPLLRRRPYFIAVRGRLTLDILRRLDLVNDGEDIALGDPGLFFPDIWPDVKRSAECNRAYIPHESEWGSEKLDKFVSSHPEIKLIDVRRPPKAVFASIASCSEVFSSSLHGLIAADALGIPNRWVRLEIPGRSFEQDRFKFDDYYSAYGVSRDPCELSDIHRLDTGLQIPHERIIERHDALHCAAERIRRH